MLLLYKESYLNTKMSNKTKESTARTLIKSFIQSTFLAIIAPTIAFFMNLLPKPLKFIFNAIAIGFYFFIQENILFTNLKRFISKQSLNINLKCSYFELMKLIMQSQKEVDFSSFTIINILQDLFQILLTLALFSLGLATFISLSTKIFALSQSMIDTSFLTNSLILINFLNSLLIIDNFKVFWSFLVSKFSWLEREEQKSPSWSNNIFLKVIQKILSKFFYHSLKLSIALLFSRGLFVTKDLTPILFSRSATALTTALEAPLYRQTALLFASGALSEMMSAKKQKDTDKQSPHQSL
jgi:hypothetical protein